MKYWTKLFGLFVASSILASILVGNSVVAQSTGNAIEGLLNWSLQNYQREQQRKQKKKVLRKLNSLIADCDKNHNVSACNKALAYNLSPAGRSHVLKVRAKAVSYNAMLPHWRGCFNRSDLDDCESAIKIYIANPNVIDKQSWENLRNRRDDLIRGKHGQGNSLATKRTQSREIEAPRVQQQRQHDAQTKIRQLEREKARLEKEIREKARLEKEIREKARLEQERRAEEHRRWREAKEKAQREAFLSFYNLCQRSNNTQACEKAFAHSAAKPDELRKIVAKQNQLSAAGLQGASLLISAFAAFLTMALGIVAYFQWRQGNLRVPFGLSLSPRQAAPRLASTSSLISTKSIDAKEFLDEEQASDVDQASNKENASDEDKAPDEEQATDEKQALNEGKLENNDKGRSREPDENKIASESTGGAPNSQSVSSQIATAVANPAVYVASYIVLMLPTYLLPYLGSNSLIMNAASAAVLGLLQPLFLIHLACLALLVALAWFRGVNIDKKWLAVFPVLAMVFDLMPGMNVIPLVPTVMHLLAITLGVVGTTSTSKAD